MWAILIETPQGVSKIVAEEFTGTDQVIAIKKIIWESCENINKDLHYGASRLVVPYNRVYSITRMPEKTEGST